MHVKDNNPARLAAAQDYSPSLVKVNESAIAAMTRPSRIGAMGSMLEGSALAGNVHAYVPYFLVMDSMNYQFWDVTPDGEMTRYAKDGLIGALAMQSSFLKVWSAFSAGVSPTDRGAMADSVVNPLRSRIEAEGVEFIFGNIPEAESRKALLLDVLNAEKLLSVSSYLADRTMNGGELGWGDATLLAYHFSKAYGDDRYLKKAQLTLMFIAAEWNATCATTGKATCRLDVSACADYQLPKVLRALGVIEFSEEVSNLVEMQRLIPSDGCVERAIRAATVLACDGLATKFEVGIAAVDFWLWEMRNTARSAKFHLTRTTAY